VSLQPHEWQEYSGKPPSSGIWDIETVDGKFATSAARLIDWSNVKRYRYAGF
jgi:hypothetical protein